MLVEYDIDAINNYLKQKQATIRAKQGVEVKEASNADILAFFGNGRK